ncbi:MAG: hypothetical protein LLG02_15975 [Pelosinus sp.]|nr:hypothetical protein [Pelosinus sp.]
MTNRVLSWATPAFLSGYLATHSWTGAALQLVNILLGVLIYLPFVRLAREQKMLKMQREDIFTTKLLK